jgi:hypothetical protein
VLLPHSELAARKDGAATCRRLAEFMEYLGADSPRLMLAVRITLPHFIDFVVMSFPNSAGKPASTMLPRSANRAFNMEESSTALIALLSLATISAGVFLGAPIPCQPNEQIR